MELDKVEAAVLRRDEHHLRMDASVNSICHAEMSYENCGRSLFI
jgi:hypothetical protein